MSRSKLTRNQLAKFLPNPEAIKAFELLLSDVGTKIPDDLEGIGAEASNAAAAAGAALAALAEVANGLAMALLAPAREAAPVDTYTPPSSDSSSEIEEIKRRLAALESAPVAGTSGPDPYPMQIPTRNPRIDGSWADLWVPDQRTFVDNVMSLRNQSRDAAGTIYGLAAICCLDGGGTERGAFGYSRNSAIQPAGYTPDIVYVEFGDPFAGDANPSSFQLICTMAAGSAWFPGTTFVPLEHVTKTGETIFRSRGGKAVISETETRLNTQSGNTLIGRSTSTFGTNGILQLREGTNEYILGMKNGASKEWVWSVNANTIYLRNATDSVTAAAFANGGRTLLGGPVDDGTTRLQINGGIKHSDTTLLRTSASLTNGAGAAAGTLTNAPTAGNPSKWIAIDDNGTVRYIPAW